MSQQLNNQIKALAKKEGVKVSISTVRDFKYITFKSEPTAQLESDIRKLQTVKHFGDSMDDSQYTTGISFQFDYQFPLRTVDMLMIDQFCSTLGESYRDDYYSVCRVIMSKFGIKGIVYIDCGYVPKEWR